MNAIAHASAVTASGPRLDNRRVFAALIDLVVLGAGAALIGFVAGALNGGEVEFTPALDVILLGWALYYYFACESGGGQTIGKRLMKLRVVRADGGQAGMREIFVRTILRVIDGIALYLVGLIVMLVTGERRQRLGDLAGGTVVVDAAAPARAASTPAAVSAVTLPELPSERVEEEPTASMPPVPELRPFEPSEHSVPEPEVLELEPEPVVEVESEPVVELESEPVVELEPEPLVEVEPEPLVEVEPEPLVEPDVEPEPIAQTEPEPGPSVEVVAPQAPPAPVPLEQPAAEAEAPADGTVVIKPVETVSAIDLVMGEDAEVDR